MFETSITLMLLSAIGLSECRRVSKTNCSSSATFYRVGGPNTALLITSIIDHTATSLEHCIDLCVDTEECRAFNIKKKKAEEYECHLKPGDHVSNPESVATLSGFSLYDTGSQDLSRQVGIFLLVFSFLFLCKGQSLITRTPTVSRGTFATPLRVWGHTNRIIES